IMYLSIFKDGSTRLEEMFNVLPVKAQKAILATAFRDYDSPNSERMVDEIQNSVRAYYALSQDKMFAEAKNFKEARIAVENWKRQYQMDDVTGESYLPADNFSNFVLHLAAMYKGESQSFIQNTFGKIYDLIQGTQEETLFEQPDNTPRTLVQAIKEALNLDYNGQQRSNVLVGDTATSQRGQQGSNGALTPRERVEDGNGTTDDTGRTESIGEQSEIEPSLSQEEMLSSDDTDNQLSAKIARRIEVQEDDWVESGKYGDTYKQTIIVDGTHKVIKVDTPDTKGNYTGSTYEYDGQTFGDLLDVANYIDASSSLANAVAVAEKETDTTPTEKQKEAGNYKKGHVQVGTFNITIENPKGSVRSGIDTEGNKWETTMQNTYGYIRGTEGVDGDHIDVFLSDDIDGWNGRKVFVVDQYNEDGSFDEHKVMLGFNETDDAEAAYFANYDSDWAKNHKTVVTAVNLEDFEKWIDCSHRKTKPFAEYKSVKTVEGQNALQKNTQDNVPYTIAPVQYTTKRGKVLDMQIVKFGMELSKDEFRSANAFAKSLKGWYDAKQRGFLMRSEDDAKQLVDAVIPKEDAALSVTQSEDSENAVEHTPLAGEDIIKMAERIAKEDEEKRRASKENARKAEEAGKEPVSLEHWKRMDGDARMAEAGKRPLTREEIESASTDEVLKANALDYLDGNQGMIQSISYLKVYEDVRYSNRTAAADSGATDSAQLDTPALGNEQRVDVRDRGQSGNSNARLDRETGEEGVPAEGGPLHADPSDARSDATGNGNGGSETLPVRESVLQPGDSRGDVHSGSSVRSGEGRDVGGRTGRKSSTTSRKNSKWGVQADTARNAKNDRGLDLNDPLDKELADTLKEFDSVLDEFNRAGREELSMSLVGMNSRQMEVLPRLVSAGAKVGYAYIKKGAHNFAEWAKRMREALGGKLKDAGLGENEIDAFIKEMWKSKLPMDGEVHTVEEWAGIIGKVELRKKVSESLEEKRKAQRAAEPIPVKTCDRENIVETLPFLLPQQQDDVLKAETQFFDESHDDRDHAFGKGYMFTNGTGTGKTYTGLGIVKRFIKQGKGRILILTPSQTKVKDWIEDAANLDIELNDLDKTAKARKDGTTAITEKGEGAVITTYANFRQNKALLEDLFDLIVYDESHRLLENKGGVGTTGSMQHYKLSNRNEQFAFLRLQDINPTWNELNAKNEEFSTQRDAIIKRIEKESGTTNELTLGQRGELPPVFNGNWTQGMELKFPELAKLRNECLSLDAKYAKEVKPELERQAKENVKHTKVVFLSATPFNTRENLDYVEGYIFSYPEKEKQDGYSTQSPRSQFYLEHFGAGYKWRYHRLESSGSNPEAVSKQEVEFSNYLQHTLQTMSGRIIDSPFDYSRNFPTVTLDKAEEFNNAMEELSRNKATSYAYHEVMGNYNYTSALFESMKVTQIIPRLKEHFVRGRKAVIFHRRVESKNPLVPPFKTIFDVAVQSLKEEYDATKKAENKKEIARLRRKYSGMLEWEQTLDLRMPREQLADAFGKNNVLFFSGKESKKIKDKAVEDFNNDASGKNVIVIQEDSGKEGISLHDTTGEHQRVLVTLALPQSPITALQIEGRIYRIGNKSNAIFEYPLLGLNTELMLFGQKFNQQVSTTENLALGSQARNLRESFARGVEEHSGNVDIDNQGVGGKEFDTPSHTETDAFDSAVLDYYTNQKLSGKRDSREGTDYYPTPEPLGFMMNQWGRIGDGESVLEPSAGHGAIARYVPRENPLTAVEPSQSLFSKLQIKAGGNGRKFENTIFEDYNVVNKHDVVLMNPPFGAGGRLAVDHVAKAFQHLEEGGRIVAIIPRGSTDKKFDKWYEEQKSVVLTAEIGLPDITFERAGTSVNCRVVVIDKVTNEILRQDAASRAVHMDLSGEHYEKIEDFFEEIRNIDVPERTIDHKAKLKKKAAPTARELRTVKGINYVSLTEDSISVSGRGVWGGLEWKDKTGKALINYLADQYRRFKSNYDYAVRDRRETQEAAYGEMKELACKLAGMTEDEMQRYIDKKSGDDMLYRSDELIESINEQFNEELQQQIDGTLPKGHIYQLGNPGNVLLGTGVPNLPIQLNSTRLIAKATRFGHNYGLEEFTEMVVS
ncbi:MAG: DEAD/DEAH box helicase family protein, partial [Bacteroides acidifaciens]